MALFLHRIGRLAFRRARTVLVLWLVALAALLGLGIGLGGQPQESYAIPGTESQEAIDQLAAVFPQTAGASARAVVQAPEGAAVGEEPARAAILAMGEELAAIDGVDNVLGPFDEYAGDQISADGRTAYIQVQFDGQVTDVTDEMIAEVTATAPIAEDVGLAVAYGGEVFQETSFGLTVTEALGVLFAGVVLVITFGSLLAAGMPLVTALVGVGAAFGAIAIVSAFTTVSSSAPMLAVMLGLAVGIDYALFILSRHRLQLARGMDPEESAGEAVATAGSAVVFAGLTVIIALLGLLVVGIPFLSVMGLGAALAVLIAILAAVTLLPALLGLLGRRLIPKPGSRAERRANAADDGGRPTLGRRWVNLVLRAPWVAVLAVVGVLGTAAIPALSLDLNLPTGASEPAGSTQREAFELIETGFGPGYNGPLIVTVDITQTTDVFDDLDEIAGTLAALDGVAYVGDGLPNETVDTAIIQVVPTTAPDDPATKELVHDIRALAPGFAETLGTPIAVTGYTAITIDISNRLTDALVPFALIVVGLSILLLMMVFRSVFVPVKAAVGFLLSVFGALGVTVAIFQWGWFAELLHIESPGPLLSFLPILLMAVLFGLAMDYEVFLVSGMREEHVKGAGPREAVVHGFQHAARVVTAAALIMFFVFFAFVPEGAGVIKGIAFALAIGVAFDAFLVRMTLVPAAMALAGRGAWWLPAWLDRLLPNVDIEGESLRAHLEDAEWAKAQDAALATDAAVIASAGAPLALADTRVPAGGVLLLHGAAPARRIAAASLAGRLPLVSGRILIAGAALPSETARARRRVAVVDLAADDAAERRSSVREAIAARLDATGPWYRIGPAGRSVRAWTERLDELLGIDADAPLAALSPVARASVLVAAALAERPAALVVDLGDGVAEDADGLTLTAVLERLVPPATLLVLAAGRIDLASGAFGSRGIRSLDLGSARALDPSYDRKAALR